VEDVTAGAFAQRWVADYEAGRKTLMARRKAAGAHPAEAAGAAIRAGAARRS